MSSLPEFERDVRALYVPDIDDARFARALERTLRVVDDEIASTRVAARRPGWHVGLPRLTPRALLIMLLVLIAMAAVAVAAPQVRRILFGEADAPANRVDAFQHEEEAVQLGSIDDPAPNPVGSGLALELRNLASLPTDDPMGWGEPRADYARLLFDRDVEGVRVRVAAAPTSRGFLCYVSHVGSVTGGACLDRLDANLPAKLGSILEPDAAILVGVLTDGVRDVRVELTNGRTSPALVEANAFAWVGRGGKPRSVIVTMDGGRTVRFSPSGGVM